MANRNQPAVTARINHLWRGVETLHRAAEEQRDAAPPDTERRDRWGEAVRALKGAMDELENAEYAATEGERLNG